MSDKYQKIDQPSDRLVVQIINKVNINTIQLTIFYSYIDDGVITRNAYLENIHLDGQKTKVELNIPHKIHDLSEVLVTVVTHGSRFTYKFSYHAPKGNNKINKLSITPEVKYHKIIFNDNYAYSRFENPSCNVL
jgi:hypothetical protein